MRHMECVDGAGPAWCGTRAFERPYRELSVRTGRISKLSVRCGFHSCFLGRLFRP